jgi:hypothetical protein
MQGFINIFLVSGLLLMSPLGNAQPSNHTVCGTGTVLSFHENYLGTGDFTANIRYSIPPSTVARPSHIRISTSNPTANVLMSRGNIISAYFSGGAVRLYSHFANNNNCMLIDEVAACKSLVACDGLRDDR